MNWVQVRQYHRNVVNRRKVTGAVWPLVNGRGLKPECTRVLHMTLLIPVLLVYGSETI